jgi:hypothetical protein
VNGLTELPQKKQGRGFIRVPVSETIFRLDNLSDLRIADYSVVREVQVV